MAVAVPHALSTAERSYPMSKVRGRSREDPMPEGQRPRRATPRLRSGAGAGRTPCPKGGGQEELPHVRGQGQWPRVPGCDCAGMAERSYPVQGRGGGRPGGATPRLRSGAAAERSYQTPEARGGSWKEQPHIQGAVAAWAQEGLEELSNIQGQEGRW